MPEQSANVRPVRFPRADDLSPRDLMRLRALADRLAGRIASVLADVAGVPVSVDASDLGAGPEARASDDWLSADVGAATDALSISWHAPTARRLIAVALSGPPRLRAPLSRVERAVLEALTAAVAEAADDLLGARTRAESAANPADATRLAYCLDGEASPALQLHLPVARARAALNRQRTSGHRVTFAAVSDARILVTCALPTVSLPLRDIVALAPGDHIVLDTDQLDAAVVAVAGRPLFAGRVGLQDGQIAVRLAADDGDGALNRPTRQE